MLRRLLSFFLVLAFGFSTRVSAHDPGLSSAQVTRVGTRLEVRMTFAWSDLSPLIPSTAASERPDAAALALLGTELAGNTSGFVRVHFDDAPQPVTAALLSPGTTSANEVVVSLVWSRVPIAPFRLEFPFLTKMPFGHRMILTLDGSAEAVALLDARHLTWELAASNSAAAVALPDVGSAAPAQSPPRWTSFILLGVEHILTGSDHLCFLAALLLVAVRMREVVGVVTAFTVAHSLTLAAAATGLVSLSPRVVEPLIAASIIYVGVENLFLRRPPQHRTALVFGFGLVHGLGFAGALAERLPGVTGFAIVPPLLSFNVGVELGQLAVAAALIPLLRLVRGRSALSARLQPALSLAIAAAGVVWFCQRV